MRRYWPMKSRSSPPMTAPANVARQCAPMASEYCPLIQTPSKFWRTAASKEMSLVALMRVARAPEKRARQPAVGRKIECRAPLGDDLPGVPGDKAQLARLPLELHDIHHHVVCLIAGREERGDLSFHRKPAERNSRVRATHAQRRVCALEGDERLCRRVESP